MKCSLENSQGSNKGKCNMEFGLHCQHVVFLYLKKNNTTKHLAAGHIRQFGVQEVEQPD